MLRELMENGKIKQINNRLYLLRNRLINEFYNSQKKQKQSGWVCEFIEGQEQICLINGKVFYQN